MNAPVISWSLLQRVGHLPAAGRALSALLLGGAVWLWCPASLTTFGRLVASWDAFALALLALIWSAIYTADADRIRAVAASEDLSQVLSFVFVLVAAAASLLAVVMLLHTAHGLAPGALARHVGLSAVAVGTAWLLVHTVFTLRYAHTYYDARPDGSDVAGLDFPGGAKEPDYLDIAYFAFIIGMAAQTADVSISSYRLRRLALLHGLISFSFNTALVALVVSSIAGVL